MTYLQLSDRPAPIGLFDSGVGGLSVYLHLVRRLPNERYIYFADTKNVPYGSRSSQEIVKFTLAAIDWLVTQGCKLIVIACNSASAYALKMARLNYPDVPIVGLVPALKPAVLASRTKHVAVLATQATLDGQLLNQVISQIAEPRGAQVTKCFDPALVPWVEAGMPVNDKTATRLLNRLHQYFDKKVDHLVLGCTHYPFFKGLLEQEIEQKNLGIKVVDSGAAIAARVEQLLIIESPKPIGSDQGQKAGIADYHPPLQFYASHDYPALAELVQSLVQRPVINLNRCY